MKKYLVVLLILCVVASAWAKSVSVKVEFSYDPDFEQGLNKFSLYYLDETESTGRIHVGDLTDVTQRIFDTPVFDLPPGKTSDFILVAVHNDGEEFASVIYPWKFTGKPAITNIDKR